MTRPFHDAIMPLSREKEVTFVTLDELKSSRVAVGRKETERALEKGEALRVFLASDCDERISIPVLEACAKANVPVVRDFTRTELGRACGIKVKAACCALLR